jgi:hypothetical protein
LRRELARFRNIGSLVRFVTSSEEKDGLGTASAEVNSVAWPIVNAEFADPASESLRISEVPNGKAADSGEDTGAGALVPERKNQRA